MKIKPPNRVIKLTDLTSDRDRYRDMLDHTKGCVVNRSEHIDALGLAVLSRSNVLYEGKHGVAKTLLAEIFFRMFRDTTVFKKQFMKGTQLDELFGPMLTEKYRKEGIWEHNIAGMLPTAHFALCDEIYRGSDSVLPSMMRILNERRFINGKVDVVCPLITAVGTSNFVTDTDELAAFNDRWLIRMKVEPLGEATERLTMLEGFLQRIRTEKAQEKPLANHLRLSLEDLTAMIEAVRLVPIPREILALYEDCSQKYKMQLRDLYVSDRRLCDTLRILQASAFMSCENVTALLNGQEQMAPECLVAAQYGLTTYGNVTQGNVFATTVSGITEMFRKGREEMKQVADLQAYVGMIKDKAKLTGQEARLGALQKARKAVKSIDQSPPDKQPTTAVARNAIDTIRAELNELIQDLSRELSLVD